MKKHFLLLITLFAVSLLALAEMTVYVYKKDGTKVQYVASTVDSIGFVNIYTITFNANGGEGSMDVLKCQEGESITLSQNTFTNGQSNFVGWNTATDGSGTAYEDQVSITPKANITLYAQWKEITRGFENGYEWVDLGLPSGTLWATCNVGAESPEDYGDYFAWGEIESKEVYDWSTYKWCGGTITSIKKYCTYSAHGTVDGKTSLEISDDIANVSRSGSWRIPSLIEFEELINNCLWIWTRQGTVNGYKIVSKKNSDSIFIPAAGYYNYSDIDKSGIYGYYWSSTLYSGGSLDACYLRFGSDYLKSNVINNRIYGQSVRPVLSK